MVQLSEENPVFSILVPPLEALENSEDDVRGRNDCASKSHLPKSIQGDATSAYRGENQDTNGEKLKRCSFCFARNIIIRSRVFQLEEVFGETRLDSLGMSFKNSFSNSTKLGLLFGLFSVYHLYFHTVLITPHISTACCSHKCLQSWCHWLRLTLFRSQSNVTPKASAGVTTDMSRGATAQQYPWYWCHDWRQEHAKVNFRIYAYWW